MSIFSRIFNGDKAIDRATGILEKAGDAVVFTQEERANHFLNLLKLYEPFKLAQRLLALIIGIPYALIWIIAALLYCVSMAFDPCMADQVCKASQLVDGSSHLASANNETLGSKLAIILAFYFGGGAIEGIVRARK